MRRAATTIGIIAAIATLFAVVPVYLFVTIAAHEGI